MTTKAGQHINGSSSKPRSGPTDNVKVATSRHLKLTDVEEWRKDNHHIHTGYHPLTDSWRGAWASLLAQPHNETVNVLTHLVGALIAGTALIYTYRHLTLPKIFGLHPSEVPQPIWQRVPLHLIYPFPSDETGVTFSDSLAFVSFYLAAVACFGCSATFHTSLCHSEAMSKKYNKIDYVGIVFLITGTYYPAIYYGYFNQPMLQLVYMTFVTILGSTTAFFVLSPGYATPEFRRVRTWLFIGLGLSGIVPIMQSVLLSGWQYSRARFGLDWLLIGGAYYIGGALLYAERIPERIWPGRFDIYGSSHQIFHVACLFAALSHYIALCQAFNYRHHGIGSQT